jgi:hypothetical protein
MLAGPEVEGAQGDPEQKSPLLLQLILVCESNNVTF